MLLLPHLQHVNKYHSTQNSYSVKTVENNLYDTKKKNNQLNKIHMK